MWGLTTVSGVQNSIFSITQKIKIALIPENLKFLPDFGFYMIVPWEYFLKFIFEFIYFTNRKILLPDRLYTSYYCNNPAFR